MNQSDKSQNLKSILNIGSQTATLEAIFVYAIKKGKIEFIKTLDNQVKGFWDQLSEAEKQELRDDVNTMLNKKAEDLVVELSSELPEEEVKKVLSDLK
jgi:hypothetical protein